LRQVNIDDKNKTVREELRDGFLDIKKLETQLTELENKMQEYPEDMEIIEDYTTLLEQFHNHG